MNVLLNQFGTGTIVLLIHVGMERYGIIFQRNASVLTILKISMVLVFPHKYIALMEEFTIEPHFLVNVLLVLGIVDIHVILSKYAHQIKFIAPSITDVFVHPV